MQVTREESRVLDLRARQVGVRAASAGGATIAPIPPDNLRPRRRSEPRSTARCHTARMDGAPHSAPAAASSLRTVGLALVVTAVVVGAYVVLRAQVTRAAATGQADRGRPGGAQVAAASGRRDRVHARTEPGVGSIEDKPASDANPPSNPDLLPRGIGAAPDFSLKTPEGETVSLASLHGKVALLEFFATWCPHCVAEAPHLAALGPELRRPPGAVRLDQRRLRGRRQRLCLPPLLRPAVPGAAGSRRHAGGASTTPEGWGECRVPTTSATTRPSTCSTETA